MAPATFTSYEELAAAIPQRGDALIVVPVFNAHEKAVECVASIARTAPISSELLVIDDGSTAPGLAEKLAALDCERIHLTLYRRSENLGFVVSVNEAFRLAGRRDVIVVNSDVVVGEEWFERLRSAAYSDPRVATATPLTNNGTITTVPAGKQSARLLEGHTIESAARAVARASLRLYPEMPVCVGHLVYFRRAALDLAGFFDEAFSPGYSEEIDFSMRCVALGLRHVCADDVFVHHCGSASFQQEEAAAYRQKGDDLIRERYPFYFDWVVPFGSSDATTLAAARATAEVALCGLHMLVDATCLNGEATNGSQRITLEMIRALKLNDAVAQLTVLIEHDSAVQLIVRSCGWSEKLHFASEDDLARTGRADVAFRPHQVHESYRDLHRLRGSAKRTIVWQLDFLSFATPFYHRDLAHWQYLRGLTRETLKTVDGVALLSEQCLDRGRELGLIPEGASARVVHPGVDHGSGCATQSKPAALEGSPIDSYLLQLGTDYGHKNRDFTVKVFREMRLSGYEGGLVCCGAQVPDGGSKAREDRILEKYPELGRLVLDIPKVTEAEREWLVHHADLVMYPSLAEGFGLIPFEAAACGTACLPSRLGSLDEVLPKEIVSIDGWNPQEAAECALALVNDVGAKERQIELIRQRGRDFTWAASAAQLVELAHEVLAKPARWGEPENHRLPTRTLIHGYVTKLDRALNKSGLAKSQSRQVQMAKRALRAPYRALIRFAGRSR